MKDTPGCLLLIATRIDNSIFEDAARPLRLYTYYAPCRTRSHQIPTSKVQRAMPQANGCFLI